MGVRVTLVFAVSVLFFPGKAWTSEGEDRWIANNWPAACKQALSGRPPKPIFVVFR